MKNRTEFVLILLIMVMSFSLLAYWSVKTASQRDAIEIKIINKRLDRIYDDYYGMCVQCHTIDCGRCHKGRGER
jgi:hypothetical protein